MKIRVVSSKSEIDTLSPNEKIVHLAFRPSNVDFLNLMKRCPRVRVVQVPHSYKKTMSRAMTVFLEMQDIELLEGDVWGHRKDLDEYFTVDEAIEDKIGSLLKEGVEFDEMAETVQKTARLAPDLIKYIARTKITA